MCQGVYVDPGMFAYVSVIVPGVHACGGYMHVGRSLSVLNVCGAWGYMCTFVHGEDVCVHVWDANMYVFNVFVHGEHACVCMCSPALVDPGPH